MRGSKISYCSIFVQLVEWAPADAVAQAFVDLVVSREPLPTVVNLVHPQAVPWSQALGDINNQLSTPLPVILFSEWISKLEAVSANADAKQLDAVVSVSSDNPSARATLNVCTKPAIKLLEFFRTVAGRGGQYGSAAGPSFTTSKLQGVSPSVREMAPLNEQHARSWVKYWKKVEYI